jgi:hypothetical protein
MVLKAEVMLEPAAIEHLFSVFALVSLTSTDIFL